jgi:predicted nicotinamide N-methyase
MVDDLVEEEEEWIESPDGWGPESPRKANDVAEEDDEDLPSAGADLFVSSVDPRETFRYAVSSDEAAAGEAGPIIIVLSGYKLDSDNTDQSTGVTLWRAAPLLADYLIAQRHLVCDKRVLELGAGLGLCGLVAHHLGAATTILTDGDKYALAQLRSNVRQNTGLALSSSKTTTTNETSSAATTAAAATTTTTREERIIECRTLLWGKTPPPTTEDEKFDVILGADVIYGWDSIGPLLDTVAAWLKKRTTTSRGSSTTTTEVNSSQCLLSWKTRYNGVPVDVVQSAAADRQLSWTEVSDGIFRLTFINE